jgi:hypothetical protein
LYRFKMAAIPPAAPGTENPANADIAEIVQVDDESADDDSSYGDEVCVPFCLKSPHFTQTNYGSGVLTRHP